MRTQPKPNHKISDRYFGYFIIALAAIMWLCMIIHSLYNIAVNFQYK